MMVDNAGFLRIQKIQDNYNMTISRQEPLDNILELKQLDVLGCRIDSDSQFTKVQWINHTSIQKPGKLEYNDREIFLFFYQCFDVIDKIRKLKAIEIAVFKEGFCPPNIKRDSDSCFVYTRINDGIEIQYDVIDLALGNLTFSLPQNFSFKDRDSLNISSHLSYTSDLAIVCGISTSFSNLLLIYDFNITGANAEIMNKTIVNMTLVKYNSASKLVFDTFKVNSVVPVPNSKFLVAAIDGFGAIFYHTGINEIVYKINITQPDPMFGLYDSQAYGDMKIFIISVVYPYNMIVMTNIGTLVYGMSISMNEETKILSKPDLYTPKLYRVYRFPFYISDIKEVTTPYGVTLLIKSPMGRGLYQTLLTTITFFMPMQSKVFKTIVVDESGDPENLNCTSFMRNRKLETTIEDQVGISMLCNQRMRAARFSLRPNMNLSFSEYIQKGQNAKDGVLSFNNFSIYLQAENDYTNGDINNASVNIIINYSMIPKQRSGVFTFVIVALLVFFSMILFLFVRSRELKYESYQESQRQQQLFERDEFQKTQSMFYARKKYEDSIYYPAGETREAARVDLSQGNDDDSLKQRQSKRMNSKRDSRQNSKRESRQQQNTLFSQQNTIMTQQNSTLKRQETDQSFKAVPNTFHQLFNATRGSSITKQKNKQNSAQFGQAEEEQNYNQVRLSHNIQDAELTSQTFENESFATLDLR